MHNDGHNCFPRGSVENYADGKFPLSDDRAPLPFHHHDALSRPTRWRREDFSFACQKRQNQTFPYRTDHGAKYLPGKPARARPLYAQCTVCAVQQYYRAHGSDWSGRHPPFPCCTVLRPKRRQKHCMHLRKH